MCLRFNFRHAELGMLEARPMTCDNLADIVVIEQRSHLTPWNEQHFNSSITGRHVALGLFSERQQLLGYIILSIVAEEAEILLFVIDIPYQNKKLGSQFLGETAKQLAGRVNAIFLEVRAGNIPAISLYESTGFNQIGERRNYYPTPWGLEDAIIYALEYGSSGFDL